MSLRVLLVEDSATDALLLERELRRGGYDLVLERVETHAAFVDALSRQPWDIVISDYSLVGWKGTDALLAAQAAGKEVPFILVSGTIGEELAVEAIKAGANDYLLKDRLTRLPSAVARALEDAEVRRDRRRAQAALAFLALASARLAESLEQSAIAETAVRLAVPPLADRAALDLVTDQGALRRIAVESAPAATPDAPRDAVDAQVGDAAFDAASERVASEALRRGASVLVEADGTTDPRDLTMLALPLSAHGATLGALTLAVRTPPRSFVAADVSLAEEFARRASVALENARLYREAQRAIAAREEFLLIASHELKTPLTPLMLQVQALVRSSSEPTAAGPLSPRFNQSLDATLRHVRRLGVLVDQLLDISSLGSARLKLVRERLDLAALVGEIARGFEPQATAAGCLVVMHVDGPVWGSWDRSRVGQVLSNLLSNAFKFGAGKPVEISVYRRGSSARLHVHDGGHGIASADRARIFARFERAVPVHRFGGFGLGLWVARQVVEAHGGSIDVSGEPDEGATFTVELPAE